MALASVSLGVAGALGPDAIARIAPAVEAAGFHALWVNDTPGGDSIAALAAAAAVTSRLVLATGVVPVDRRPAAEIVAAVRAAAVPQERLVLGIGAGGLRSGALAAVRDAASTLRDALSARVLVGALGPKMRHLAVTAGEGPLLSWLTPDAAAVQADEAHAAASDAHVALYVRTALDAAAQRRLDDETARYGALPTYAANFARWGIAPADTVLDAESFSTGIGRYREAVDEVVLRAIVAHDTPEAYERFAEAAVERLRGE